MSQSTDYFTSLNLIKCHINEFCGETSINKIRDERRFSFETTDKILSKLQIKITAKKIDNLENGFH